MFVLASSSKANNWTISGLPGISQYFIVKKQPVWQCLCVYLYLLCRVSNDHFAHLLLKRMCPSPQYTSNRYIFFIFLSVLILSNLTVSLTYQTAYLDYVVNTQLYNLLCSLNLLSPLHKTLPLGNKLLSFQTTKKVSYSDVANYRSIALLPSLLKYSSELFTATFVPFFHTSRVTSCCPKII